MSESTFKFQPLVLRLFLLLIFIQVAYAAPGQKPFEKGREVASVPDDRLIETSGIVASRNFPGYLWAHNDSGDSARLFLFHEETGEVRSVVYLKGIQNRDWEDMTIGPGPDGTTHLFVGEIGDNRRVYENKIIYYFPEPSSLNPVDTIREVEVYSFNFPDENRDSETLMIDPDTRSLWLFSKWEPRVRMYQIPFVPETGEYGTIRELGKVGLSMITAGEFSPDGSEMLLKSYESVFYLKRATNTDWEDVLLNKSPANLPYKMEKQGEAICWKLDGRGYYTMSEGTPVLIYYPRN